MAQQILIVENDPHWAHMLDEVSSSLGYSTCRVSLARDAINMLTKTNISLIIVDILLPSLKGHLLLHQLRKNSVAIPVIVVAGYITPEVAESLVDSRVNDIIVKSNFRVKRLSNAISTALKII